MGAVKLGFFTRLLKRAGAADRYLLAALDGQDLAHPENHLYPAGHSLLDRVWQATFSSFGGTRAGVPGHGLPFSRTQPCPKGPTRPAFAPALGWA